MADANSITGRIKNASTGDLSGLLDIVIHQTRGIIMSGDFYHVEVAKGYERLALELRNSLKGHGCKFRLEKTRKGYLFTVYEKMEEWMSYLRAQKSPLLKAMEFA